MSPPSRTMKSVDGQVITASEGKTPACSSLEKLPLEIRLEIYRYLVGRYAKQELNTMSEEYKYRRGSILGGGDHTYKFHPAIFGTNKQIRSDAFDLFGREHTFVHLVTEAWTGFGIPDQSLGISVVAKGHKARIFPKVDMTILFDRVQQIECDLENKRHIIFVTDDFPDLVPLIARTAAIPVWDTATVSTVPPDFTLRINIDAKNVERFRGSERRLRKLVKPLSEIRKLCDPKMIGPAGLLPYDMILAVMQQRPRSAQAIMDEASCYMDEAEKASERTDFPVAIKAYKQALNAIAGANFEVDEGWSVLEGGRFDGIIAATAADDTKTRIHAHISRAYLALGKHRLARIWVERVYGPLHNMSDRHLPEKFPLQIKDSNPAPIAELLAVAAQISRANGDWLMGGRELSEARRLDPASLDIINLEKQYLEWNDARIEKRERAQRRQQESKSRRVDDCIEVVLRRLATGDQYFQQKSFSLARTAYEAAHTKFEKVSEIALSEPAPMRTYCCIPRGCTQIKSKLTHTCLELGDYNGAAHWASNYPKYFDSWLEQCPEYREYNAEEYQEIFWARGFALSKVGKIDGAIRSFEKARKCHDRCEVTYWQLQTLYDLRDARLLDSPPNRCEEVARAEKRLLKNKRHKELKRERRARGCGVVVGIRRG